MPKSPDALPKSPDALLRQWTRHSSFFVGAYRFHGQVLWSDGTKLTDGRPITGPIRPSDSCVKLFLVKGSYQFQEKDCQSPTNFICERPVAQNDPCALSGHCSGGIGNCTAVGCSFRCVCPDSNYGDRCQYGPFSITITRVRKKRQINVSLRNNAEGEIAKFTLFENGQKIRNYTLAVEQIKNFSYNLENTGHDSYISVVAILVNKRGTTAKECLAIPYPKGIDLTDVISDKCNATILNVLWKGFNWTRAAMEYTVYVNGLSVGSSQAGRVYRISGLKPRQSYKVKAVPRIPGCGAAKFKSKRISTADGPSRASTVKVQSFMPSTEILKNCTINWNLIKAHNSAGYKINITEEARLKTGQKTTNLSSSKRTIEVPQFSSNFSFETKPNSVYHISVGTKAAIGCDNIAPKWSTRVSGCATGTSAPATIPELIMHPDESKTPTVTLKQANERNGPVSCYFVVVQVMNSSSNSSEVTTNMEDVQQANASINVGDSYVASAIKRFDSSRTLQLGDGKTSCCNIRNSSMPCEPLPTKERRKRAISDVVHGQSRPFDPDRTYRHYVLISTPRSDGGEPFITASPISDAWSIPEDRESISGGSNSLSVVLPIIIVIVLIAVIAGVIIYRRRTQPGGKPAVRASPRVHPESLSIEPGEFIDMAENSDSIIDRELAGFTLRLADLFQVINTKRENEDMQFSTEFKESILDAVRKCNITHEIAHLRPNQPKNRYKDIVPYDRARVSLSNIPGVEFSDYVNASYIDGYAHPRKFIATQGPKPETIEDFWRMVLEQDCRVVVMLTNLTERMKVKCAQYWPDDESEPSTYGSISVKLQETVSYGDFLMRRMVITRYNESLEVSQFHFIAWPDHGVPTTTSSLLRFHYYVVSSQPSDAGPIVVHCSAGVGRTGTFIALDHLSNQITEMHEINIAAVVGKMRTKRPQMVQTLKQYILIHKLVLEMYQFGDTDRDISEFNSAVQDLNRGTLNTAQEFEMLNYFLPLDTSQDHGAKESNAHLNRNPTILPYDHNRAFIQMEPNDKEVPYYNASVVASYDLANQCIAAQNPDDNSLELFWRVVLNNDVKAIVALGARHEIQCYWPEHSKSIKYGIVTVRSYEERRDKGLVERLLEVSTKTKKATVLQLFFDGWPQHCAPSGSEAVLEIISKLEKHYQTLPQQEKKSIIVHCSDGSGRTGTFCAISNLIERLKNENRVDVFRMAKDLRDLRPGMIGTEEQYAFCYQAVSEYLQLFDLYGNFQ